MFKSFAARLSIVFFLLSALILGIVFTSLYVRATQLRTQAYEKHMGNFVELSSQLITGEDVLAVPLEEGCEELPVTKTLIQKLKNARAVDPMIFDVYLMVPDPDPAYLRFVTNADRERTPVGCGERYEILDAPQMLKGFRETYVDLEESEDKWGTWVSAYAPIKTASGKSVALIGMDIAQETVAQTQAVFIKRFVIALVVCLTLSLVLGLLSSIWLTKPIRRVINGMEVVAGGDLDHKLENFSQTEFDRIATIFNRMTQSLKRMMRDLEISTRENERVRRELEIATEIQQAIFPDHPPEVEGLEIEAKSVPAKEVGGDYFDFLPSESKNKMGFIIADASGKGLPGTLYMTRSRSVFKVVSAQGEEPGETLSRSNAYIASDSSSRKGMFITVLYLLYDKQNRKMTYSSAGHYNPLWYKNKEKSFCELKASGVPVGIVTGQQYPEETIQLSPGDLLVMYTDGVIEAKAENGKMFTVEKLKQIIEKNCSLHAHDLFKKIEDSISEFIGKAPPFDDMTLIVIRVK